MHKSGKCWIKIGDIISDSAVILVSHKTYALSRICDRRLYLSSGESKLDGTLIAGELADQFTGLSTIVKAVEPKESVDGRLYHHLWQHQSQAVHLPNQPAHF